MPIYMDRHNLSSSVTAENVAHIHQEDLKIQHQYGCRGLTYWFDDKRCTAFCLIEAPNEAALKEMHRVAHGDVPHIVIEVEPAIVESFLGRIGDPVKAQDTTLNIINDPAFRTLMVMELTGLMHDQPGATPFGTALNKFNNAVPGILDSYKGKLIKAGENHYLVSFHSVSNAVHAAIDIHALFKHYTRAIKPEKIRIKTGLSAGVPVTDKKSIFEACIKAAERLSHFIPGEIIISAEVNDLYNSENIKTLASNKSITPLKHVDEIFLQHLVDYIENTWQNSHLMEEDFCKAVGCSKSQLYRKMIILTGKSPNTFIKDYRLEMAFKLLNKKAGNISEIAFETGFSSPSYFSKCFQKKFGQSPSNYLAPKISL